MDNKEFPQLAVSIRGSGVWGVVKNEWGEKESDEEGAEVVVLSRTISISTVWKGAGEDTTHLQE